MTDQEINAKIAEACGWLPNCDRGICWDQHGNAIITPPNYCNDLNAMHEAENILSQDEIEIIYPKFLGAYREPNKAIRATAHQRAEAFLKTVGKWKEND
jgi:hypothetical protein